MLAWLLGEALTAQVREVLQRAEIVVASELTLVEVDRVLVRSLALGESTEAATAARRAQMQEAASRWQVLHVTDGIMARARRAFPSEPVRTLDALHLASALEAAAAVSGLELLSLDARVRRSGELLGFRLQPLG